jgi:hypothetical protein
MRVFKALTAAALALGALATWPGLPAHSQQAGPQAILCNKINNASSSATVGVSVAAVPNQTISVCGFHAIAGAAAGTFQLLSGTGATCAGGQTLTPVIPLPINGSMVDHIDNAWFTLPSANNLCVSITGTGPVSYNLYYVQF